MCQRCLTALASTCLRIQRCLLESCDMHRALKHRKRDGTLQRIGRSTARCSTMIFSAFFSSELRPSNISSDIGTCMCRSRDCCKFEQETRVVFAPRKVAASNANSLVALTYTFGRCPMCCAALCHMSGAVCSEAPLFAFAFRMLWRSQRRASSRVSRLPSQSVLRSNTSGGCVATTLQ